MIETKKQLTLEDLAEKMDKQEERLIERMDKQVGELAEKMDKQGESLIERMDKKVGELAEKMDKQEERLIKRMDKQVGELAEKMDKQGEALIERMDKKVGELAEKMDKQEERLIERMDKQGEALIERMDKQVGELAIMTAQGFEEQRKYIDEKFTEELAPIKAKLSEVVTVDYLNKRISELNGESITRDRKLENCQSEEIKMHVQNENLTGKQQQELAGLKIFPAISQA